jgi:hypothetical protein
VKRDPESGKEDWIPAFAGMTACRLFLYYRDNPPSQDKISWCANSGKIFHWKYIADVQVLPICP